MSNNQNHKGKLNRKIGTVNNVVKFEPRKKNPESSRTIWYKGHKIAPFHLQSEEYKKSTMEALMDDEDDD